MQPLISPIDHESRHNSHRSDSVQEERSGEDTPLLRRFPAVTAQRSPVTTAIVTLLLIILLSGVIIGIYLLILQSRAENILPPVETPLRLVSRSQWDRRAVPNLSLSPRRASQVIVVQTDSPQCHSTAACSQLLLRMQKRFDSGSRPLPYNFLISSDGQTYEALGWRRQSPLFPRLTTSALVLAFIGNFTENPPSPAQLLEAKNFFAESVSRQYLNSKYTILGKNTKHSPKHLFASLEALPQWRKELSDYV